ncbi:MAG: hypothetical protein ACLFPL_01645 [Candidatus Nanoarchaeia archaeon]
MNTQNKLFIIVAMILAVFIAGCSANEDVDLSNSTQDSGVDEQEEETSSQDDEIDEIFEEEELNEEEVEIGELI